MPSITRTWVKATTGESTFTARAPDAKERALPSLERVTAYAANNDAVKHGEGNAGPQNLDIFDHPQLLYQPKNDKGAFLEIPISVKEKEPLRLLLNCCTSYDFGMYQPYLNGTKIGGPIDLYSATIADHEFHLLDGKRITTTWHMEDWFGLFLQLGRFPPQS